MLVLSTTTGPQLAEISVREAGGAQLSLWRSVKALEEGEKPGLSRTGRDLVAESVGGQKREGGGVEGIGGRVVV